MIESVHYIEYKITHRGVAKPGIAAGLGPVDRRFKSFHPDHNDYEKGQNI